MKEHGGMETAMNLTSMADMDIMVVMPTDSVGMMEDIFYITLRSK